VPPYGISSATFHKWKSKYGKLEVSDARRLRRLEQENERLKNLLADSMLDNAMLKEINAEEFLPPSARRQEVAHLREVFEVSQRSRFCYRRLYSLLCREGSIVNHEEFWRLHREERLQVRRCGGRKRALSTLAPMTIPQGPNQRWSLDLVSGVFACGQRFRMLAVVDDYSRECVRLIADTSVSGALVRRELDATFFERMAWPHTVVSDNGTELTRLAILRWSKERNVEGHDIASGSLIRTGSSRASMHG